MCMCTCISMCIYIYIYKYIGEYACIFILRILMTFSIAHMHCVSISQCCRLPCDGLGPRADGGEFVAAVEDMACRSLPNLMKLAFANCPNSFSSDFTNVFERFGAQNNFSGPEMKMINDQLYELQNDFELEVATWVESKYWQAH